MIKTVLDEEIEVTAIPHPSGFNYDVGRYSFETSDGFKMNFVIAPHFYRRSGDSPSITSPEDWDPPNIGKGGSCESYLRLVSYNCKGLPFRYTVKIRGSSYTSRWVTDYDRHSQGSGMQVVQQELHFDESEIDQFLEDHKGASTGRKVPARLIVDLDYGGIDDGHQFQQDTNLTGKYQELNPVTLV